MLPHRRITGTTIDANCRETLRIGLQQRPGDDAVRTFRLIFIHEQTMKMQRCERRIDGDCIVPCERLPIPQAGSSMFLTVVKHQSNITNANIIRNNVKIRAATL